MDKTGKGRLTIKVVQLAGRRVRGGGDGLGNNERDHREDERHKQLADDGLAFSIAREREGLQDGGSATHRLVADRVQEVLD